MPQVLKIFIHAPYIHKVKMFSSMTSCVIRCGTQRSRVSLMYIVIETHKKPSLGFPGLCVCSAYMHMCDACACVIYV